MYRCGIRCKKWFRENALRYYAKHREEIPLGRFLRRQAILSLYRHRKSSSESFIFFFFLFFLRCDKNKFLWERRLSEFRFFNLIFKETPPVLLSCLFSPIFPWIFDEYSSIATHITPMEHARHISTHFQRANNGQYSRYLNPHDEISQSQLFIPRSNKLDQSPRAQKSGFFSLHRAWCVTANPIASRSAVFSCTTAWIGQNLLHRVWFIYIRVACRYVYRSSFVSFTRELVLSRLLLSSLNVKFLSFRW